MLLRTPYSCEQLKDLQMHPWDAGAFERVVHAGHEALLVAPVFRAPVYFALAAKQDPIFFDSRLSIERSVLRGQGRDWTLRFQ